MEKLSVTLLPEYTRHLAFAKGDLTRSEGLFWGSIRHKPYSFTLLALPAIIAHFHLL